MSVDVCDYTESYGGVTTYDIYVAEHGETAYRSISIDDYTNIYSGQFDMVKIKLRLRKKNLITQNSLSKIQKQRKNV